MNTDVTLNQRYDTLMYEPIVLDYFQQSDFANFGYWNEQTLNPKQAGENLVEQLLCFIPEKTGTILDVACGKGETSRYLTKYYPPDKITGINISEKQLESCRANVPGATFLLMDAVNLEFEDASFDTIICVEAAFHFNTREQFLKEAYRVLKPGGYLVLSDILKYLPKTTSPETSEILQNYRKQNFVDSLDEYQSVYEKVGFISSQILDVTEQCWRSYFRYFVHFIHEKFLLNQIDEMTLKKYLEPNYDRVPKIQYYLLVAAQKSR